MSLLLLHFLLVVGRRARDMQVSLFRMQSANGSSASAETSSPAEASAFLRSVQCPDWIVNHSEFAS
jgi:hypothetical protein